MTWLDWFWAGFWGGIGLAIGILTLAMVVGFLMWCNEVGSRSRPRRKAPPSPLERS